MIVSTVNTLWLVCQTCYIRKAFGTNRIKRRDVSLSDLTLQDWSLLNKIARDDVITLNRQMQEQGWIVKNVLLRAEEQVRYTFDKTQL